MARVSAAVISCPVCGEPSSLWAPTHPQCAQDLPPVIGERFRDALAERAIATLADNEDEGR